MMNDEIQAVKIGKQVDPMSYPGTTPFEGERYEIHGGPEFLRIWVLHTNQGWSFSVSETASPHPAYKHPPEAPRTSGFGSRDEVLQGVQDYLRAHCGD